MRESLALRNAKAHVKSFADERDLLQEHSAAMDCRDCEDYLQLGIDAFRWLDRADEHIRRAVFSRAMEYDPQADEALDALYREWMGCSAYAEEWIARLQTRGYHVENLAAFRDCVVQVAAIVHESRQVGGRLAEAKDRAIESHRRGETTAWECDEESTDA